MREKKLRALGAGEEGVRRNEHNLQKSSGKIKNLL
jgi:hypothetical protein